jgi:hypothetical protein
MLGSIFFPQTGAQQALLIWVLSAVCIFSGLFTFGRLPDSICSVVPTVHHSGTEEISSQFEF